MADRAATKAQDRLELLEAELWRFVEVASEEFGAERIIVFGSLARAMEEGAETLGEWSDLDLVVVAETNRPFHGRIRDPAPPSAAQGGRGRPRLHAVRVGMDEVREAFRKG